MPSPGRRGCINTFSGRLGCPLGILNVMGIPAPIMGRTAEVHGKRPRASDVREEVFSSQHSLLNLLQVSQLYLSP